MPITVLCPSCSARISAPDNLAGKSAKCPKCQAAFLLPSPEPGFEVVEDDEPTVAPSRKKMPGVDPGFEVIEDDEPVVAKPRKKPRQLIDDEEDDFDDERPRRKKRPARNPNLGLLIGGGIAIAFVVLAGLTFLVIYLAGSSQKSNHSDPSQPAVYSAPQIPNGWVRFSDPEGRYTAALPGEPRKVSKTSGRNVTVDLWQHVTTDAHVFQVSATNLPADAPTGLPSDQDLDRVCDGIAATAGLGREEKRSVITLSGIKGREMIFRTQGVVTIMRLVVWNKIMYTVATAGQVSNADSESLFSQFVIKR